MIEILMNILVGILLIAIIYFLIQYALKFQQERLIQEDYRNKVREQENLDEKIIKVNWLADINIMSGKVL